MKNIWIVLIGVLISSPVQAEMYQWVNDHGVKHFSNSPSVITGQDVTVQTVIKTGTTRQRVDDRQPSDDPSNNEEEEIDQPKKVRKTTEIKKAEKLVEELTQSTELAAANYKRASNKKRYKRHKLALYREYMHEQEKLQKAQNELERLKSGLK